MNYIIMYSTTLLVSFTLTLILYLHHRRYWNTISHKPIQNIYILNMTSALMCIVWCLTDGKPELSWINTIANLIEFNSLGFCGYFWMKYCLKFMDIPAWKTGKANVLLSLPILTVMVLILSSPATHFAFYIDEDGFFQRGTIYFIQQTGYLYILLSSILCLWYRKKCSTSRERRHINVLAMFPLSPAFFGGLQILAPSGVAPTLQFSILISLFSVFVDELDQKITRDSLTQLTNHYEFERILQNKMKGRIKGDPKLYVLVCDMDDFKSINDNYGHIEGDEALKLVAKVLNQTGSGYDAKCARMSGDEFLALLETDKTEYAESFTSEIQSNIRKASEDLPYDLDISIGIAEYDGNMSLIELIDKADKRMYAQKRLHRKAR